MRIQEKRKLPVPSQMDREQQAQLILKCLQKRNMGVEQEGFGVILHKMLFPLLPTG
jgi:hypothetical protein